MAKNKYPNPLEDKKGKEESRPKKEMSETQLLSIVDQELNNALGKMDTKFSNQRLQAMKYYLGDKTGNLAPPEAEGRSTVVSMDVSDTIEWILPSLIRIFTSGENAVEYSPRAEGDEPLAEQMTDWANYVFYTQNEGFITIHDWFKDALLQKLGIIKTWWDDSKDVSTEEYEGVTLDELALMMQDGTVEVIQKTNNEDGTLDIKVKKTVNSAHICVENVPPEEFLFSRKARTSKRIFSCHHRILKTVTELKEMGYENTDDLMNDDNGAEFSQEAVERNSDTNEFVYGSQFTQPADPTMRMVWITETYMQVDWNGDGLAEWRKVVKSGKVLLANDEIEEHPFSLLTPIKMPHKLVGRSVADLLMDLQDIKTSLMRQFIDNAYLQNNQRMYVDENAKVNIDDLLDNRVGGIVRGKGQNGVTPIITPGLSPTTFSLLDYLDQVKESRTGINKTFKGLDADTLNGDKTATATNAMLGAAREKIELIARIFAETGVKDLFRKILKLSGQYQKQAQVIRVTGKKFVPIDPRAWKTQYDISVNVGLGNGNKDQTAAHIIGIMNIQKEAAMNGLPICGAKQIYNAASKLVINSGFKSADPFFVDPDSPEGQQIAQSHQSKPDPAMLKLHADQQQAQQQMQMDMQKNQAELQLKQQTIQMENERQRQNDERDYQRESAKANADMQLEMAKMEQQHQYKLQEMHYNGELELRKHAMTTDAVYRPQLQPDLKDHIDGAASVMADTINHVQQLAENQAHIANAVQQMHGDVQRAVQVHSAPRIVKMKTSQGKELVGEITPKGV